MSTKKRPSSGIKSNIEIFRSSLHTGGGDVIGRDKIVVENLTIYRTISSTHAHTPLDDDPAPPCPYPGLAFFGPEDSERFYGRDRTIEKLETRLRRNTLTALIGASGSGKSSVILAGLAPRLHSQGSWRFTHFRIGTEPDGDPFLALSRAMVPLFAKRNNEVEMLEKAKTLADQLRCGTETLTNVIGACGAANPSKRILLIADQFEEIYTLVEDETVRQHFIAQLLGAFSRPSRKCNIRLIITMRGDFFGQALQFRPFVDALQNHVETLGPMNREELQAAIIEPARKHGVLFESALVKTLLDSVMNKPASLPLLQFTLREMWGQLDDKLMTLDSYSSIGGIEGALSEHAQKIYDSFTREGQDKSAANTFRRLLTQLVNFGEGSEDTRRIASKGDLDSEVWSLAQQLADEDNRLVVTNSSPSGTETVEIVHEALIRNWPTLVEWLSSDRPFQAWLNQLRSRVLEWRNNPTDEGTLLRGGPLALAEDWFDRRHLELNEEEQAYIFESRKIREVGRIRERQALEREQERIRQIAAEQERTARLQQRARRTLIAMVGIVLIGLGLGALQYKTNLDLRASMDIRQQRLDHSQLNLLAQSALSERQIGHFDGSLRLAVRAARAELELDDNIILPSPVYSILAALVSQAEWRLRLGGHLQAVNSAAYDQAVSRVVTASFDGTARIWDSLTGERVGILTGHNNWVTGAAFNHDGSLIVTSSMDHTARIWDATRGSETAILRGHEDGLRSALFSRDGSRIVTASDDKTARVWESGKQIAVLHHDMNVAFATFNNDGARIITASADNKAHIWDTKSRKEVSALSGHTSWVGSVDFSPDGSRIATGSGDGTARIWDADTFKEIAVLRGHDGDVRSVSFSPDGSLLVTGSTDRTARIWNVVAAKQLAVLRGHENQVLSAVFSSDGKQIVTASIDQTARTWPTSVSGEIAILPVHQSGVNSASFNRDGTRIVTASVDGIARVWDVTTGKELQALRGHQNFVQSATFSPDGTKIVTASQDATARLWDAQTGDELGAITGHNNWLRSATFSPDGARIATASGDGTARIWDVSTSKQVAILAGHGNGVSFVAFSPDGSRLVTASYDNTARVWDTATSRLISIFPGHSQSVHTAAFNSDGSLVVTASVDGTARVWEATTAKEIAVMRGHEGDVTYAAFSPDGKRVVTSSSDNTARIWDPMTATEITVLRGHENSVTSAEFSPDGTRVVTASMDTTVRIWDTHFATMSVLELIDEACTRRLRGSTILNRDEMRLAGQPDEMPAIDVCADVKQSAIR